MRHARLCFSGDLITCNTYLLPSMVCALAGVLCLYPGVPAIAGQALRVESEISDSQISNPKSAEPLPSDPPSEPLQYGTASPSSPPVPSMSSARQRPKTNTAEIAASAPATAPVRRLDPQADQILHAWADQLRAVERFRFNLNTKVRIRSQASNVENKSGYRLAAERPNKLALLPQKQASDPGLICDGTTLYCVLPILKHYTEDPAPGSFEDLATGNARVALTTGGSALTHIDLLLARDPYDNLTALAIQARYLGSEILAGTPCDHLLLTEQYLDLEVWIEAGPQRLLRQLTLRIPPASPPTTLPTLAGTPPAPSQTPDVTMETTLAFSNWVLNPDLPPDTFRFVPPTGARKVPGFLGGSSREPAHPLLGQPAPPFAAPLLDGSIFDLASLKGRIAVLDFWASWSAGSAERLPAHARLARQYAARGVLFLAVNVEESERAIREFLAQSPLDLPIALDRSASIAKLYRVQRLPQTVLNGPDGRIQAVHGPLPADTARTLRTELDRLLARSNPSTQPERQADR